ncbi:pantothenate kinase [Stella humosa]|uniref:Type III pantothenate kinase n=1 Tax=Stella humosa TaxID=94 RepID=A0A3N1ML00_9PROT|nr:type III pantothenate kinase [Stella humosa]ROQ01676.1 pantothenate kinase [Stella humosa]BBK32058.1 type III pantothenate kinase [Stella humosa]
MLLAIDIGNTNSVFALTEGDAIRATWRCVTDTKRTADEYGAWLTQLMGLEWIEPQQVTAIVVATVVPESLFNVVGMCRRYFRCEPLVVGDSAVHLGVEAKVDRPREVGADRLVNGLSAHRRYGGPAIVIDFGTATTFDVIDGDGNYNGGVIAPGINLSLQALHMAAARLPRVDIKRPEKVIGRNTIACMQSGVYWGYVGLIEGIVARIRAEWDAPLKVIGTGGLVPLFAEATNVFDHVDGDLTLHGLIAVHALNSSAPASSSATASPAH